MSHYQVAALDTLVMDISNRPEDRLFLTETGYMYRGKEEIPADVHYVITGGDVDGESGECKTDVYMDNYIRTVTYRDAHIHNLRYDNAIGFAHTMEMEGYTEVIRYDQQAMYMYTYSLWTPYWRLRGDSLRAETHDELYRMAALAGGGGSGIRCVDLGMDYIDLRGTNGGIGTRDGADIDTVRVRRGVVSCCGIDRSLNEVKQLVIHTGTSFKAALLEAGTWGIVSAGADTWGSASLIPYGSAKYQIKPVNELGIRVYCVRVPHGGGYTVSADNDYEVRTWRFPAHHAEDPCYYLWLPSGDYTISTPEGLRRYIELEDKDIDLLPRVVPPVRIEAVQEAVVEERWEVYTLGGERVKSGASGETPTLTKGVYVLREGSVSRKVVSRD